MANINVAAGKVGAHAKTLVAATVDTVTFAEDLDTVEVLADGTTAVYFTVDGTTPVVADDACWELPAGVASRRVVNVPTAGNTVVKLISAGTPKYSVGKAA